MPNVAEYIARTLGATGARVMFGYPGQSNLRLLQACRSSGIRYVQTADERGAAFAAAGYADSSDAPAVVCVSKGPAATNLLTSLMSAHRDGVPMLAITGNVAQAVRGRNSFQEFDPAPAFMAAGAVKDARYVDRPEHVPGALRALIRTGWTEPRGPVLLDMPYTLLGTELDTEAETMEIPGRTTELANARSRLDVQRAARYLQEAHRPVVIVGRGARHDYRRIREFIATFDLPAVHTMGGTGVIASSDSRYGGFLRHLGNTGATYLVQNADLILALGTGLDDRTTADRSSFAPGAVKIQVDLDPDVLGRSVPVDVAVNESVLAFLTELAPCLPRRLRHREFFDDFAAWRHSEPKPVMNRTALGVREVIDAMSEALHDVIVVKDSGSHKYWVTKHAPCALPRHSIASCHFGSMGFGLPAAVGASIAVPHEPVIAVCGDGCLRMSLAELRTAAEEQCGNLKIVVFNNGGLGSTRDFEHRMGVSGHVISDFGRHSDYTAIARAMGIRSYSVRRKEDLPILSERLGRNGLAFFDCHLDPAEPMSPSVSYTQPLEGLLGEHLKRSA